VALVQAEADANRAQLATVQRQLDKTVLRAPFDADVTERHAQTGEAVAPGSLLYVLAEGARSNWMPRSTRWTPPACPRRAACASRPTDRDTRPVRLLRIGSTVSEPARTRTARLAFETASDTPSAGHGGPAALGRPRPHLPPQWLARRNGRWVFL
jgi:multidrug efflux pump subunit AcrA (membrane-fusion protein)